MHRDRLTDPCFGGGGNNGQCSSGENSEHLSNCLDTGAFKPKAKRKPAAERF
jgi:hypothetical protein